MQVLTAHPGERVTFTTSGWQENGFDWNRIPGATSIHLPFDQLRAKVLNVDAFSGMEEMLYSDEAFAGGLSQERENGNFGMKLHEHDKYNGSHRARISYHFFGNTIVALGSDIENVNQDYPTETTVFQLAAITPEEKAYWDNWKDNGHTYLAPNGVGYYVPGNVQFEKNFPQVTVGERSVKPTSGDWVSLVFNHGKAPQGASYEYAVLPQTDEQGLTQFAKQPTYQVLQKDRNAHIVTSSAEHLTSYVLFETPQKALPGDFIEKADTSCLAMVKQVDKKKLVLTVAQPDMAFYRGPSDEAFDENGKRIERSIYSRPWIDDESKEIPVTITLKGKWNVASHPAVKVLESTTEATQSYTVQSGDAPYLIANEFKTTVEKLNQLNEGANLTGGIRVGQVINVPVQKPKISVKTVETQVLTAVEPKTYQTQYDDTKPSSYQKVIQQGKAGQKKSTIRITRINGEVTEEKEVDKEIIQEAVPEIIVKGTQ